MDLFVDWVVNPFLESKKSASIKTYNNLPSYAKKELPVLHRSLDGKMPLELVYKINERVAKIPYVSDPLLSDFYNHPKHVEYKIHTGDHKLIPSYDCDDLALYAYALAKKSGVKDSEMYLGNLLIAPWRQLFPYFEVWANHIIFVFRMSDWWGVIDTNSAYNNRVLWYEKPLNVEAEIVKTFNSTYQNRIFKKSNVQYYKLVQFPYPFSLDV